MKVLLACLLLALPAEAQRVVVIIADDVGVDRIGAYAEHRRPGRTPNIDGLAERGLLFRNAWTNPVCSPSRASLLTGRYGFRTGVGGRLRPVPPPLGHIGDLGGLGLGEVSLADLVGPTYRRFAFGKWHIGDYTQAPLHPNHLGFDHFAGELFNSPSYFFWRKTVNGVHVPQAGYSTTDVTDGAVAALQFEGPSLLWVAFHAAHGPIHEPPDELHTYDLIGPPMETSIPHSKAMIEAMDTEIARILDAAGPDAFVFFVGDNGTQKEVTDAPFDPTHGKNTMYEGGINVPLIVAGPGVSRGECAALVNLTDIFATVAEIAGRVSAAEDSISLFPYFETPDRASLRTWVYAERFGPNGPGPYNNWRQAVREERFKLIRRHDTPDELYDLELDPFEQENLLTSGPLDETQRRAYLRLSLSMPHDFD